jgi:hypothetical protein
MFRFGPSGFLLGLLLTLAQVCGQPTASGTISGVVVNEATGELLANASLRVEGAAIGVVTERGGAFSLPAPAGSQILIVSYSGLETARVQVDVPSGGNIQRRIGLNSSIYKLEPFSVVGLREGTTLALQAQRQAMNAKTVAGSDTYGNPSANVGELLQRMPGIIADIIGGEVSGVYIRGMEPGFSTLMIDGNSVATATGTLNSRGADISQFGTGNLDSVNS